MKVRVLYNIDGGVSIIHPAIKSKKENETEQEWLARVFAKATPEGVEYEDIDHTELPSTREDRNFWKKEKGKPFEVDTVKKAEHEAVKNREELITAKIKELAIKELEKDG